MGFELERMPTSCERCPKNGDHCNTGFDGVCGIPKSSLIPEEKYFRIFCGDDLTPKEFLRRKRIKALLKKN